MPGQPVILDTLGGIVATARPEDIPEGASPRNNDCDFIVGRFTQRPGCQSVYTQTQSASGPLGGTTATDISTTGSPWANPGNILLNDGSYATVGLAPGVTDYGVSAINLTQGGYYPELTLANATVSGSGSGAVLTCTMQQFHTIPVHSTVVGVTVNNPGIYTSNIATVTFSGASPGNDATGTVVMEPLSSGSGISDVIQIVGFSFSIPATDQVNGIGVNVKGFASSATVYAQLLKGGVAVGNVESIALPTSNGFVSLGGLADLWGSTWLNTDIDSPEFGVNLWVGSSLSETVSLDYVEITIYTTPSNANYNGIVSANLNQTDQVNLFLDANGLTWEEDVTNDPNVLNTQSLIPVVPAGSYLKGLDANGTAYMAYSDLSQGTSQPMQFNGKWCDRITQVGPGQAPVFTPQQATSDTFTITQITQQALNDTFFIYFLQSEGPGSTSPGSVVTVYYSDSTNAGPYQALVDAMQTGFAVYVYTQILGTPTTFGPETVQVTSIGLASPPNQPRQFYYFTFNVPNSAYTYYQGSGHGSYEAKIQVTLATMQMAVPVPGLEVGNQVTISANSAAGYNSTWPIAQTLNSGAMSITSTSVTGGVATFDYAVQSGANPQAGELVTITNTTNANGALNLVNASINTSTGGSTGSFTILTSLTVNFASVPESGQATTAGTLFCFDPGLPVLGTGTNPIFGTGTGGSLTFTGPAGISITAGVKQGSVFFITRNGAVTRPAPPVTFTVPSNTGSILATQIPVGPPNVVARGITCTESGQNGVAGANFYYYDTPETFTVQGVQYTSQALIIPDNVSTTANFSFSDAVLLASDEIDIPGNNFFNLMELGNPAWMFQYAGRMLYGLCQTKIQNLLNMSFDGGYLPTLSSALPMPTGWTALSNGNVGSYSVTAFEIVSNVVTVIANNSLTPGLTVIITGLSTGTYLNSIPLIVESATSTQFTAAFSHTNVSLTSDSGTAVVQDSSVGLVTSLDFGNALRIMNLGASTWTNANILIQGAYQDYLGVNIIQPNTPYSVRVKARSITQNGQQVTIQLPTYSSGAFGPVLNGSASFTFNQGPYQIQSATLITGNGLATVPPSLVLAVGVSSLAVSAGVEIDRIEIFPTNNPVDTTTIWTSYAPVGAPNYEAVDIATGSLGVGLENPQPATGAFELIEQLYIEKTASLMVTQDSPSYEPNNWQVRQASDRAGSVGPNAFNEGEEFTLSASRNGVYFFDGGKPMPILRELQSTGVGANVWETINWNAGKTIWIRNDLNARRLLIGVPMITPNFWLPKAPIAIPIPMVLSVNSFTVPRGAPVIQVTFASTLPALVAGQTYTFSNMTGFSGFTDGTAYQPTSVAGNVATFSIFGAPIYNGSASGTAAISGITTVTSPNVILMCNYTGCPTGEELASSPEVHVTMFGDMKALDMRRKWSIWQIPCPAAEFVPRQDGLSEPIFLCNGISSGKIYQLVNGAASNGQNTDDGSAINWSYTTYGFTKAKQGQQNPGLGALRKIWYYLAATMEGVGQLAAKLYSNSLGALPRNTFTVPLPFTLSYPQQNDQERVLEIGGQRVFIEFSSIGTGGYAEVGPIMLDGEMDKNSPHRGVSS